MLLRMIALVWYPVANITLGRSDYIWYYRYRQRMSKKRRSRTREEKTVEAMLNMYCADRHGTKRELCGRCRKLLDYSKGNLRKCPLGKNKPTCAHCTTHCYRADMREKVKDVMRYSGPRMAYRHPVLALFHFFHGFRKMPADSDHG